MSYKHCRDTDLRSFLGPLRASSKCACQAYITVLPSMEFICSKLTGYTPQMREALAAKYPGIDGLLH